MRKATLALLGPLLLTTLAVSGPGCPPPSTFSVSLPNSSTGSVFGTVTNNSTGNSLTVFSSAAASGYASGGLGGQFKQSDGKTLTVWLDSSGRPEMAVADSATFLFANYAGATVDVHVFVPGYAPQSFSSQPWQDNARVRRRDAIAGSQSTPHAERDRNNKIASASLSEEEFYELFWDYRTVFSGLCCLVSGVATLYPPTTAAGAPVAKVCCLEFMFDVFQDEFLSQVTVQTIDAQTLEHMTALSLVPAQQAVESRIFLVPNPVHPGAGQGVTVTASVFPAQPGIALTYNVLGTDGYAKSGSILTNSAGKISFHIPGASSGVVDTVDVAWPSRGITERVIYTFGTPSGRGILEFRRDDEAITILAGVAE